MTVLLNAQISDKTIQTKTSITAISKPVIKLTMDYSYYEYWNEDQDGREFSEGSDETLFISKITKADGTSESFLKYPPAYSVVLNGTTISSNSSHWVMTAPLEGCDEMLWTLLESGLVFKITYGGYDYQFTPKEVEIVAHSPSQENKDRVEYINSHLQ